jgi:hypothetical protein
MPLFSQFRQPPDKNRATLGGASSFSLLTMSYGFLEGGSLVREARAWRTSHKRPSSLEVGIFSMLTTALLLRRMSTFLT